MGMHSQNSVLENKHFSPPPHTCMQPDPTSEALSHMEESSQQPDKYTATDLGKRAAGSLVFSPQKQPSAKKHHWAERQDSQADLSATHTALLAAFSASDAPVSENTIKAMLLSLKIGL